jgi:hypothetical protein
MTLCQYVSAFPETLAIPEPSRLLYDLISPREQRGRHIKPEGLRGPQVQHQFVLGRRLHWEVGGLVAFEDAIDVAGRAPVRVDQIRPIGDQAAASNVKAVAVNRSRSCRIRSR